MQVRQMIAAVIAERKSTILKMIIGEEPLDGGEVILAKGKTLGYLAQRQDLKSGNTIYEEVKSAKADIFAMEAQIRSIEHELKHLEGEEMSFNPVFTV